MNKPRVKGTAAESTVVAYLRGRGFPAAERRALHGTADKGDIVGITGVVLEVKAVASPSYGAWLIEAERERVSAGALLGAVVHKPKGLGAASVAAWRVILTMDQFATLLNMTHRSVDEGLDVGATVPAMPAEGTHERYPAGVGPTVQGVHMDTEHRGAL